MSCSRQILFSPGDPQDESGELDLRYYLFQAVGADIQCPEQQPAFLCDRVCSFRLVLRLSIRILQDSFHLAQILKLLN